MMVRTCCTAVAFCCLASSPAPAGKPDQDAPPLPQEKYLEVTQACLETLIAHGTDRYGPEHSPMFCSILDLETHRLPPEAPPLLPTQRRADRAYPGGNLHQDLPTLLTMYHLSQWSGQPRYRKAADAYLEFFLRRCAPVGNGLFPCGEHAFWDFHKESEGSRRHYHEELAFVPAEFLDHLWRIDPHATERHIRALRRHISDEKTWTWNRHASIYAERAEGAAPLVRHGGFYVYQWSYLYARKPDPQLLAWANKTVQRNKDQPGKPLTAISLGLSLLRANRLLGDDAQPLWEKLARRYVTDAVASPKHNLKAGAIEGFQDNKYRDPSVSTYGFWDVIYQGSGGYAFLGAEKLAIMCLCMHRLTGDDDALQFAKGVCDFYLTHPQPKTEGIVPGKFAGLIALALDLYDLTGQTKYLEYARHIADEAIRGLYSRGLIRAATGKDYYEAANGPGSLLMELLRLHLVLTGSDYPLPRNYWDT